MAEDKPKKKQSFDYKLLSHADKLQMVLEQLLGLEETFFLHNINMLDKDHSEYNAWLATRKEIEAEIMRMRTIFEKLGGNWELIQNEQEVDEYGEPV